MSKLTPVKQNRAPKRPRCVSNVPSRRSVRLINLDEQEVVEEDMPGEEEARAGGEQVGEQTGAGEQVEEQTEAGEDLVEEGSEETRVEVVVKKQKCSAEKHVCEECGSEFEKTGNFNRHVKDLHSEKEGGWGCKKHKLCYEKFSTKHEMLLHKAGCRFRCPNCVWSTDRSDRIDLHLKVCK